MNSALYPQNKLSHKLYAIINALVLAIVIWWNYYSNTGNIGGKTVGELSAEYDNYFTPAGYAFAIWGIIYLALSAQAIFFLRRAFSSNKESDFLSEIGPYLIITNIFNAGWLYFWLMENTGISVVLMLMILGSLVILVLNLNMERWDAPEKIIAGVWWPIAIYLGWISVATIANISAYLAKINWTGPFNEITWAIIMIAVATGLYIFLIWARSLRESALVGVWALFAIAIRHWDSVASLKITGLIGAGILLLATAYHGFQNRMSNPFFPDWAKNQIKK
ncbi:hypothetical protein [Algoriphagus sediminis]|uniref:Tryptophan-rich sensory protein n=1 Tax=Algoriphagus sediminis TaxID=3057113 RepID=A0ABT7YFF1_9BACT|nr:hypothetical protein [Algoriphagus sediminis]MDN3205050.1 hypothetical protein [Algoriphagus sediminis]